MQPASRRFPPEFNAMARFSAGDPTEQLWAELEDDTEERLEHERRHSARDRGRLVVTDALKRAGEIFLTPTKAAPSASASSVGGSTAGGSLERQALADFGLLEDGDTHDSFASGTGGWSAVADLDVFFTQMYAYWYDGGLQACLSNGVVGLAMLLFTVALSTFFFAFVDWPKIMSCKDEDTCEDNFAAYVTTAAIVRPSGYHVLVWMYCGFFGAYWLFCMLQFWSRAKGALRMKEFYGEHLKVPDRALAQGAISWAEVVERLLEAQQKGSLRVAIGPAAVALDAHWIAARIMRRENYLTALLSHGALDLEVPWRQWVANGLRAAGVWGTTCMETLQGTGAPTAFSAASSLRQPLNASFSASGSDAPGLGASAGAALSDEDAARRMLRLRRSRVWSEASDGVVFNRSIEWALHACLLAVMFSSKFTVREGFLSDAQALKRRFMVAGVLHIVLMPFLLVFMLALFFLKHAQEWRSTRSYLGPREWSPLARGVFREFNELPHRFEQRLSKSIRPSSEYVACFPRPLLQTAGRLTSFVAGALVAALLALTLVDEAILLYTKLWGRNLLWYMGVLSAVFAVARSVAGPPSAGAGAGAGAGAADAQEDVMVRRESGRSHAKVAEELLLRAVAHTHYLPDAWRGRCHTHFVHDAFLRLFRYKAALLAQEIFAVVMAPLVLCFSLPGCAERVLALLRLYSVDVEGVGTVCCFSTFDTERFGDPSYRPPGGAPPRGTNPVYTQAGGAQSMTASMLAAQNAFSFRGTEDAAEAAFQVLPHKTRMLLLRTEMDGKMEKSILGFFEEHLHATPNREAARVLQHLISRNRSAAQRKVNAVVDDLLRSRAPQDREAAYLARMAMPAADAPQPPPPLQDLEDPRHRAPTAVGAAGGGGDGDAGGDGSGGSNGNVGPADGVPVEEQSAAAAGAAAAAAAGAGAQHQPRPVRPPPSLSPAPFSLGSPVSPRRVGTLPFVAENAPAVGSPEMSPPPPPRVAPAPQGAGTFSQLQSSLVAGQAAGASSVAFGHMLQLSQMSHSMAAVLTPQAASVAAQLASIGSGSQPWDNSFYWMEQGGRAGAVPALRLAPEVAASLAFMDEDAGPPTAASRSRGAPDAPRK